MVIMNRRGWIKIVEAFIAILLVAGVVLIVINKGYLGERDISSQVYDVQISILREIQLNSTLRSEILSVTPPLKVTENDTPKTWNKIKSRTPSYLECEAKICWLIESCELEEPPKENIYAQAAAITTTLETTPGEQLKQLKLFCWAK